MLCVLPVVQFCTQAFNTYARLTDADVLFSSTMKYLKFFRYFWQYNVFLYVILILILLSAIYFVRIPASAAVNPNSRVPHHHHRRHKQSALVCCWCMLCPLWPLLQSVAASEKDHLQNVMNKIKAKKADERKDVDRKLKITDGSLLEMREWKDGRKPKRQK